MLAKILFSLLSALMVITACGNPSSKPTDMETRQAKAGEVDKRIVQGSNEFGLRIHQYLVQQNDQDNVFISPLSLSLALAMTFNGAAGETRDEMAKALGWDTMSSEEMNQANQMLMQLLQQPGKGIQFNIANSLWTRQGFSFHNDFLHMNKKFYQAEIAALDFTDSKSADRINQWVRKQTKEKIDQIVEHPVSDDLVMLLINAIYFKGGWQKEFSSKATREADFHLANGSTKQVMMMSQNGKFEYLQQPGFQAIRLPYGEGQMSMLIIVPDESSNLQKLHEQIWSSPALFQGDFTMRQGNIELPRFTVEFEANVNSALEAAGMKQAFDPVKADFSDMAPIPPNLYISEVKHKTFLEVNEQGSEAAAVTSVGVSLTSAPVDVFQMQVNRPFFAAIEDRQTGAWVFIGSITDPS